MLVVAFEQVKFVATFLKNAYQSKVNMATSGMLGKRVFQEAGFGQFSSLSRSPRTRLPQAPETIEATAVLATNDDLG